MVPVCCWQRYTSIYIERCCPAFAGLCGTAAGLAALFSRGVTLLLPNRTVTPSQLWRGDWLCHARSTLSSTFHIPLLASNIYIYGIPISWKEKKRKEKNKGCKSALLVCYTATRDFFPLPIYKTGNDRIPALFQNCSQVGLLVICFARVRNT